MSPQINRHVSAPPTSPPFTPHDIGTTEAHWDCYLDALPPLFPPTLTITTLSSPRAVVVAPHPDDEVLGAGATMFDLCRAGWDVRVVVVSDGVNSHPGAEGLGHQRQLESSQAAAWLGVTHPVQFLGFPDGNLPGHRQEISAQLLDILDGSALVIGPWRNDGHPDHAATAMALEHACACTILAPEACVWQYAIWAWHWARPSDFALERTGAVDVSQAAQHAKQQAIEMFQSQITDHFGATILPPAVLSHFRRSREVFWC